MLAACVLAQPETAQPHKRTVDISPPFQAEIVADLKEPWAMTFLPDGRILVTEKRGGAIWLLEDADRDEAGRLLKLTPRGVTQR